MVPWELYTYTRKKREREENLYSAPSLITENLISQINKILEFTEGNLRDITDIIILSDLMPSLITISH